MRLHGVARLPHLARCFCDRSLVCVCALLTTLTPYTHAAELPLYTQPESLVSWLGVESGVSLDVHVGNDEGLAQSDIRGGGGGPRVVGGADVEAPPPFKAADMEGLRLETWLLEVSRSAPCSLDGVYRGAWYTCAPFHSDRHFHFLQDDTPVGLP